MRFDGSMERIDLAHEAAFRLGRLTVRPGLRQLVREDGDGVGVVQPRVGAGNLGDER